MTTRLAVLVFLLGLSFVLGQMFIYEPFVVPRLASWQAVPVLWLVAVLAPTVAVCVAAALLAQDTKEWLLFCPLGGLLVTFLQWVAGLLNRPGHLKAIEGGVMVFLLQFAVLSVLLFCTVGTIRLIWKKMKPGIFSSP